MVLLPIPDSPTMKTFFPLGSVKSLMDRTTFDFAEKDVVREVNITWDALELANYIGNKEDLTELRGKVDVDEGDIEKPPPSPSLQGGE